jgi:hypothetical protein
MIPDVGNGVQMFSVFDGHGEFGGQVTQCSLSYLYPY